MAEVLCICAFLSRQQCYQATSVSPILQTSKPRVRELKGEWQVSRCAPVQACLRSKCSLCHPISQGRVGSLGERVTPCPLLLVKEMPFLLVARHPQLPPLLCVLDGLRWPNCRLLCFRKGRDFCVYCLCTGTYWLLNTRVS